MYEAIAANRRRTFLLVTIAIALLGAVGYALGWVYSTGPTGMVFALAFAGVASWGSYRYGDRIVLASTRAREVSPADAPRDEVARPGHLGLVAEIQPAAIEDGALLALEQRRVGVGARVDAERAACGVLGEIAHGHGLLVPAAPLLQA